jgi:hypothetical protein
MLTPLRLRYYERMKSSPKPSAEYTNFENAMRVLVRVPKAEVNRLLAEEKLANAGKPKRGPKPKASGHASGDKG